jgi:uncharacterized Fe-S cluster-containing radical SAM superfamily enzyme
MLPEGLKRAFWEALKVYEEEYQMPYVTNVEEIGMEKATRAIALNMLRKNTTSPKSVHLSKIC